MSEVKRYAFFAYIDEGDNAEFDYHVESDGSWVKASDYDQLKAENERLGDVLRSIACSLGAGGYNASAVDPDVFEEKICWGIDALTAPLITERDALRTKLDEARELLTRCYMERNSSDLDTAVNRWLKVNK